MTWRIFMRNGNLLERKTWGTYIMNGTRLAKKNDLAMKVMVAFAIAKIAVLIINHKTQKGFVPLLVLFALFAVGNVVFQLINDRSELMKFTSVTAFSVLVLVSVFVLFPLSEISEAEGTSDLYRDGYVHYLYGYISYPSDLWRINTRHSG